MLAEGRSIGQRIGAGRARVIRDAAEMERVQPGDVLVADMTDPDWEPVMKRAAAIVTNRGGRTCHAAIIARELGMPAVVGCGDATDAIAEGQEVTVSCAEGDTGYVYEGLLEFERKQIELDAMPHDARQDHDERRQPGPRLRFRRACPHHGVGLARLEFIINRMIGVHPRALLEFDRAGRRTAGSRFARRWPATPIRSASTSTSSPRASRRSPPRLRPQPVIVRLSDFKSNEYANLIGGARYEPHEENPMLGFRGAARYIDQSFRPCFELECRALKRVREEMGLTNVQVMVPFVRTLAEARQVTELLAAERPQARRRMI